MSTPSRPHAISNNISSTTPKLGRGIQQPDARFEARSVHQSGSKVVETHMIGLNEQIVKRKTELAELLRSTSKKRLKKNEPGDDIRFMSSEFPDMSGMKEAEDEDFFTKFGGSAAAGGSLLSDSFVASPPGNGDFSEATSFFSEGSVEVHTTFTTTTTRTRRRRSGGRRLDYLQQGGSQDSAGPLAMEGAGTVEQGLGDAQQEQHDDHNQQWEDGGSEGDEESDVQNIDDEGLWDNEGSSEGSEFSDADSPGSPADASTSNHILDKSNSTAESQQDDIHATQDNAAHHQGHHHGVADSAPLVTLGQGAEQYEPPSSCSASSSIHNVSASFFDRSPAPLSSSGVYPMSPPLGTTKQKQNGKVGESGVSKSTGTDAGARTDDTSDTHASSAEQKVGQQQQHLQSPVPAVDAPRVLTHAALAESRESQSQELHHGLSHGNASTNSSFMSAVQSFHVTPGLGLGLGLGLGIEFGSMSYTESLVHQLKVARSKNEMLQGKLRDIEELVDKNYGSISERSKLLTAERNKLERQRALLDDELVATKEELLFIRAQLQNKSARISELETELLEAQRMITVHSSSEGDVSDHGSHSDSESLPSEPDGDADALNTTQPAVHQQQQYVASTPYTPFAVPPTASAYTPVSSSDSREHTAGSVLQSSTQYISPGSAESAGGAGRREEELRASEREVEILKSLLVEQEQQLSEAAAEREHLQQLTVQYQEAISENFQLAGYLEAAEKRSEELAMRIAELEDRLKAAEDAAFEHEARAAQLEVELFDRMDGEQQRVQQMLAEALAQAKERTPEPSPKHKVDAAAPLANTAADVVPQIVFVSADPSTSPGLSLLRRPFATARVPREGYAFMLITIALLQVAVWALLLLCGLLYLGVLEGRFGVDILRDGGVYEQLFMLRGLTGLSAAVRESSVVSDGVQYCTAASRSVFTYTATITTQLTALGMKYLNK